MLLKVKKSSTRTHSQSLKIGTFTTLRFSSCTWIQLFLLHSLRYLLLILYLFCLTASSPHGDQLADPRHAKHLISTACSISQITMFLSHHFSASYILRVFNPHLVIVVGDQVSAPYVTTVMSRLKQTKSFIYECEENYSSSNKFKEICIVHVASHTKPLLSST